MKKTLIQPDLTVFPEIFHPLLRDCDVYDSSCSQDARVYFIDKDEGIYLKSAPKGALEQEAVMTAYFHSKGLATEVLDYRKAERDWLMTRAVPGEDCTYQAYIDDPKRLSEILGILLRQLHSIDPAGCPVARTPAYIATAREYYAAGKFDSSLFPGHWGYDSPEQAIRVVEEKNHLLKCDTLLHGDYCLPNVMLDNWRFTKFIDVGNGGIGDRHIDLFWGIWSLGYNVKSDAYRDRFLDAYGREDVEEEMLPIIGAFECFG